MLRAARAALACLGAAALLALTPPTPLSAQPAPADAPSAGPELSLSASVLAPLAELTSTAQFTTQVSTAVGASGGVTWWLGRHLGLRAHGVWAPAELNVRPSEFTGPIPTDLGDARYLAGAGAVTFRLGLPGAASGVEPYVGLGGGVRHLSVDPQASPDVEDALDPVGTVLAGATTRVGGSFSLRLEIQDLVSRYESPLDGETRLQNDLLVTVGGAFRP